MTAKTQVPAISRRGAAPVTAGISPLFSSFRTASGGQSEQLRVHTEPPCVCMRVDAKISANEITGTRVASREENVRTRSITVAPHEHVGVATISLRHTANAFELPGLLNCWLPGLRRRDEPTGFQSFLRGQMNRRDFLGGAAVVSLTGCGMKSKTAATVPAPVAPALPAL